MEQYPYYDVPEVIVFEDFLEYIEKNYSVQTAFERRNTSCSYKQFIGYVYNAAEKLGESNRQYFQIKAVDSLNFAIEYFAVIISNNIAVLADENELDYLKIKCYKLLDDKWAEDLVYDFNGDRPHKISDPDSVCTIVCSSGTTSQKKGVMLSQRNLLTDTTHGMMLYEYSNNARYVNIIPYTHLFGIVADLLGPLLSGGTICCPKNKMMFFDELIYYKPTNLNIPPALVEAVYKLLVKTSDFKKATGGKLKKVMCAGSKFDDEMNDLFDKYGMHIYSAYGLTECSPCVSMSRDNFFKKGSAGMILPCCDIMFEDGELCVKGNTVMLGYFNDEDATNKVLIDGWLHTGDLGYVNEDNFLFLTGRKSSIIVLSDGTKILPEEIENQMNKIDFVKESLVYKEDSEGQVKMSVIVVVDENAMSDEPSIYKMVKNRINQMNLSHLTKNIRIQTQPLVRTNLGKIKRN